MEDTSTIDLTSPALSTPDSDSAASLEEISAIDSAIKSRIAIRQSERLRQLAAMSSASPAKKKTPVNTPKKSATKQRRKKKSNWYPKGTKKSRRLSREKKSPLPSSKQKTAATQTSWCISCKSGFASASAGVVLPTTRPSSTITRPSAARNVPVANAYYVQQPQQSFHEVLRALQERIALNTDNQTLDPTHCFCERCPFSTGRLSLQRYTLMTRTYQINYLLATQPHLRDQWS